MLKMKLQKVGRRHDPSFRVIATDSTRSPKSGKSSEILGVYDPKEKYAEVDAERVSYWLGCGAQPTDTVRNLLIRKQIVKGKKVDVSSGKNAHKKEEESKQAEAVSNEGASDVESAAKIAEEEAAAVNEANETGGDDTTFSKQQKQEQGSREAEDISVQTSIKGGESEETEGDEEESDEGENSEDAESEEYEEEEPEKEFDEQPAEVPEEEPREIKESTSQE